MWVCKDPWVRGFGPVNDGAQTALAFSSRGANREGLAPRGLQKHVTKPPSEPTGQPGATWEAGRGCPPHSSSLRPTQVNFRDWAAFPGALAAPLLPSVLSSLFVGGGGGSSKSYNKLGAADGRSVDPVSLPPCTEPGLCALQLEKCVAV